MTTRSYANSAAVACVEKRTDPLHELLAPGEAGGSAVSAAPDTGFPENTGFRYKQHIDRQSRHSSRPLEKSLTGALMERIVM